MNSTSPIDGVAKSPTAPQRPVPEKAKQPRRFAPEVADEVQTFSEAAMVHVQKQPALKKEVPEAAARPEDAVERIHEMVEKANQRVSAVDFEIAHDKGNELIVKVVNKESGDVIREIPPEAIRKMTEHLSELRGLLFKDVS
ncbi:MAG: flagellar protein FlaG [Candidatus Sumerlaeota bacterium]